MSRIASLSLKMFAGLLIVAAGQAAWGAVSDYNDIVRTLDGPVRANVENSTKDEVICSVETGVKNIPVNVITSIEFSGEPDDMRKGRSSASKGNYEEAIKLLGEVAPGNLDREILKLELEYRKLLYNARLVLTSGASDEDSKENPMEKAIQAGRDLIGFLGKHGGSWHYYEANEVIGDLLVAVGKYDTALTFYQKLEAAPWPDYKTRAQLLRGRAMQAADKFDLALQAYDLVLRANASGILAEQQNQEARIGRTYSLGRRRQVRRSDQDFEGDHFQGGRRRRRAPRPRIQRFGKLLSQAKGPEERAAGLFARRCGVPHSARRARRGAGEFIELVDRDETARSLARRPRLFAVALPVQPLDEAGGSLNGRASPLICRFLWRCRYRSRDDPRPDESAVLEMLLTAVFGVHLLAVDLAMAGPLLAIWLERRETLFHDVLAGAVGRRLTVWSLVAAVLGPCLGLLALVLLPRTASEPYLRTIASVPVPRWWFLGAELAFYFICIGAYLLLWKRMSRRRGLHRTLAILAGTDLMYHFPPLFVMISALSVKAELGAMADRTGTCCSTEKFFRESCIIGSRQCRWQRRRPCN